MNTKTTLSAALLFLIHFALGGCTNQKANIERPVLAYPEPKIELSERRFKSCDEIQDWIDGKVGAFVDYQIQLNEYYGSHPPIPVDALPSVGHTSPGSTDTATNVQVIGLDEPDYLKWNDRWIFAARSGKVEVISRRDRKVVGTLVAAADRRPLLLVNGSFLFVIAPESKASIIGPPQASSSGVTVVQAYQIGTGPFPKLTQQFSYQGDLVLGRSLKSEIEVVTTAVLDIQHPSINLAKQGELYSNGKLQHQKIELPKMINGQLNGISCELIRRPAIDDFRFALTGIHRLQIESDRITSSSFGTAERPRLAYRGPENLYLFPQGLYWPFWVHATSNSLWNQSVVHKLSLQQPSIKSAVIPGQPLGRWALKEDRQNLFAATQIWNNSQAENRIVTVGRQSDEVGFAVVGQSPSFGHNQFTTAVRFIGQTAYVVTYQAFDPLHVIDLSDPLRPQVKSELIVPGFSSYLHPLDETKLIGVGSGDRGGIQVSLFDVGEAENPRLINAQLFGIAGSFSDLAWQSRAFFFDNNSKLAVFPATLIGQMVSLGTPSQQSGALVLDFSGKDSSPKQISHLKWLPTECQTQQLMGARSGRDESLDIERTYRVDDSILSYSSFGLQFRSSQDITKITHEFQFADSVAECQSRLKVKRDHGPGLFREEYD